MKRPLQALTGGLVVAVMSIGIAATTSAQAQPTPPTTRSTSSTTDGRFVVVADPAASTIYVYPANGRMMTGKLTGVTLGTHVGTITLSDGRIVLVDDTAGIVRFLRISAAGVPRIVRSVAIPTTTTWARAAWMSVDRSFSYLALSSDFEGASEQTVTVVALDDYSTHQISVPLNKIGDGYQETQVYLTGRPLQLVVTVGNEFRSYSLRSILRGGSGEVTGTADLGYYTHGPVIAPDGRTVYSTTADGFDSARVRSHQPRTASGDVLGRTKHIAYSKDPVLNDSLQQNYRPRLAYDGETVFGALTTNTTGVDPATWASTQNYEHVVDLDQTTSTVRPLARGIVSRSAVSKKYAAFSAIGATGDRLLLVNADEDRGTFGKVLARIPLPAMTKGPHAGQAPTGTEARSVAITDAGDLAYVSQGGDGKVSVIDTRDRRVRRTLAVPSPLSGGGYLLTYTPRTETIDLIAR